jgi:hypothetical protein
MQYRSKGGFESALWATQCALLSIGIVGIAWNLLKPGGWLYWLIAIIADNRPTSFYYLALAATGLLVGTLWLNQVKPGVIANLLTFACAFAGTYFILRLLLSL